MHSLVYGPLEAITLILKQWPRAIIKDASDFIHEERFEVEIPDADVTPAQFYIFAHQNKFLTCCFEFMLALYHPEGKWVDIIREVAAFVKQNKLDK